MGNPRALLVLLHLKNMLALFFMYFLFYFFYSYRSIFLIYLLKIALFMNYFFYEMPEILHNFIIPISFSLLQILVVCKYHNLRIKHTNIYSHALSLNYVKVIKRTMFVLNSKSLHYCKLSFSKYPFQKYNYDFFLFKGIRSNISVFSQF